MKGKRLIYALATMLMISAPAVYALSFDEAKKQIEQRATEQKMTAAEKSNAVQVMARLVDKGVPVEHAYRVVEAAVNRGITGKGLAEIAQTMEQNVRSGMSADKAADNALRSMEQDRERLRTMTQDRTQNQTMSRDRDQLKEQDQDRMRTHERTREMTHERSASGTGMTSPRR